jgi:hypothetical protein
VFVKYLILIWQRKCIVDFGVGNIDRYIYTLFLSPMQLSRKTTAALIDSSASKTFHEKCYNSTFWIPCSKVGTIPYLASSKHHVFSLLRPRTAFRTRMAKRNLHVRVLPASNSETKYTYLPSNTV